MNTHIHTAVTESFENTDFAGVSENSKNRFRAKFVEVVVKKMVLRIAHTLSEEKFEDFAEMLQSDDSVAFSQFIDKELPNLTGMMKEEIDSIVAELSIEQ